MLKIFASFRGIKNSWDTDTHPRICTNRKEMHYNSSPWLIYIVAGYIPLQLHARAKDAYIINNFNDSPIHQNFLSLFSPRNLHIELYIRRYMLLTVQQNF